MVIHSDTTIYGLPKIGTFFSRSDQTKSVPQCLKITQNVSFESFNFCNFQQFFYIRIDLSGNTVWLKASGIQKLAKIDHFWHLLKTWPTLMVMPTKRIRNKSYCCSGHYSWKQKVKFYRFVFYSQTCPSQNRKKNHNFHSFFLPFIWGCMRLST